MAVSHPGSFVSKLGLPSDYLRKQSAGHKFPRNERLDIDGTAAGGVQLLTGLGFRVERLLGTHQRLARFSNAEVG